MKNYVRLLLILMCTITMQSCYTTKYVDYYVSVEKRLNNEYKGKSKSYIIENYPYSPTDIKRLDEQYEILIFVRPRNYLVGNGVTRFYLKNGECYKVETNEYTVERRLEKVSIFDM